MTRVRPLLVCVFSLSLVGCFFGRGEKKCSKPQEYQESRSVNSIRIPDDLDDPARNPLRIPPVDDVSDEMPPDRPCLEEPPSYSG